MASKQSLITTQRRHVAKVSFNTETAEFAIGITGSAFDSIGGTTGYSFVSSITANVAAISRIWWTANGTTNGYGLMWGPNSSSGTTAAMLYGQFGELNFERCTLKNNATNPNGTLVIVPQGTVLGTVTIEFVN